MASMLTNVPGKSAVVLWEDAATTKAALKLQADAAIEGAAPYVAVGVTRVANPILLQIAAQAASAAATTVVAGVFSPAALPIVNWRIGTVANLGANAVASTSAPHIIACIGNSRQAAKDCAHRSIDCGVDSWTFVRSKTGC